MLIVVLIFLALVLVILLFIVMVFLVHFVPVLMLSIALYNNCIVKLLKQSRKSV